MRRGTPFRDRPAPSAETTLPARSTGNGIPPRTVVAHCMHRSSICFGPAWSETLRQTLTGLQSEFPHRTVQCIEPCHPLQPEVPAQSITCRQTAFDAVSWNSVPDGCRSSGIAARCATRQSGTARGPVDCDDWSDNSRQEVRFRSADRRLITAASPPELAAAALDSAVRPRDCHIPWHPANSRSPEVRFQPTFPLKPYSRISRYDLQGAEDLCATVSAARIPTSPVQICWPA